MALAVTQVILVTPVSLVIQDIVEGQVPMVLQDSQDIVDPIHYLQLHRLQDIHLH